MEEATKKLIDWLILQSENIYIDLLNNYLGKEVQKNNLYKYLGLPEMKTLMKDILDVYDLPKYGHIIDFIRDMEIPHSIKTLSEHLGYPFQDREDYKIRIGPFGLYHPISAVFSLFFIEYYDELIVEKKEDFIEKVRQWIEGNRLVTQTILLESPLMNDLEIQKAEIPFDLYISLTTIQELQSKHSISSSKDISISDFAFSYFYLEEQDESSFTNLYPLEDNLRLWEQRPYYYEPNVQIEVSRMLSASQFHSLCENFFRGGEENLFYKAYSIASALVVIFNLLRLPSEIERHSFSWDTAWDPYQPESGLYRKKNEFHKEKVEKADERKNHHNSKYWIEINPREIDYNLIIHLWNKYSVFLLDISNYSPLNLACKRLNESYNTVDPEDSFFKMMVGLEALFGSSPEIKFRLAIYISMLYPCSQREGKFKLLKEFYNLRSALVHGREDTEKVKGKILRTWDSISNIYDILFETRSFLIFGILGYMDIMLEFEENVGKKDMKKKVIEILESHLLNQEELGKNLEYTYSWFSKHNRRYSSS